MKFRKMTEAEVAAIPEQEKRATQRLLNALVALSNRADQWEATLWAAPEEEKGA